MNISSVDQQRRSFKLAESIYHVWITKEEVLKLRSLYIMCGSVKKKVLSCGVYISCVDHKRRSFKVAKSIFVVCITEKGVLKLRNL